MTMEIEAKVKFSIENHVEFGEAILTMCGPPLVIAAEKRPLHTLRPNA